MTPQLISETVGVPGAYDFLGEVEGSSRTFYSAEEIIATMIKHGVDRPAVTIEDFIAANVLRRDGDQLGLTTLGIQTYHLLRALNGADMREVYARLSSLDSTLRTYELVREGMTKAFLRNIGERPGFVRLYFCSPWVSLDRKQAQRLAYAVMSAERRRGTRPEVLVITRPAEGTDRGMPTTLRPFRDLGATIFLHSKLHTKLYIREPDTSGGYSMAIVGSQNLTQSNWLELGIRINSDSSMVNQLIRYFLDVTNSGIEVA